MIALLEHLTIILGSIVLILVSNMFFSSTLKTSNVHCTKSDSVAFLHISFCLIVKHVSGFSQNSMIKFKGFPETPSLCAWDRRRQDVTKYAI